MQTVEQAKVRHKTFTYTTTLAWVGDKAGGLSADGKPGFRVSSPPEFKGEAGVWTPEDLFVGAVEACHMTTFIAFATKAQLPLVSYKSRATGTLEFIDGNYRFTRIVVSPTIAVRRPVTEAEVEALLRDAHKRCLVANSITAVVEVNPAISVE